MRVLCLCALFLKYKFGGARAHNEDKHTSSDLCYVHVTTALRWNSLNVRAARAGHTGSGVCVAMEFQSVICVKYVATLHATLR